MRLHLLPLRPPLRRWCPGQFQLPCTTSKSQDSGSFETPRAQGPQGPRFWVKDSENLGELETLEYKRENQGPSLIPSKIVSRSAGPVAGLGSLMLPRWLKPRMPVVVLRHNDPRTEIQVPASTTKPDSAIKYWGQRGVFSHLCFCPNRMSILLDIRYEYHWYHWYHCEDLRTHIKVTVSNNPPCQNCNFSSPMSLCPASWLWLTMSFQRKEHDAWCSGAKLAVAFAVSHWVDQVWWITLAQPSSAPKT